MCTGNKRQPSVNAILGLMSCLRFFSSLFIVIRLGFVPLNDLGGLGPVLKFSLDSQTRITWAGTGLKLPTRYPGGGSATCTFFSLKEENICLSIVVYFLFNFFWEKKLDGLVSTDIFFVNSKTEDELRI